MINNYQRQIIREEKEAYENSLLVEYEFLEKEKDKYFQIDDQYQNILNKMSKIENELDELDSFNEDICFEMANFHREDSGLSCNFWLDELGKDRKKKDKSPRIKIEDPNHKGNFISISISPNPKILAGKFDKSTNINDIFNFIRKNYTDLMKVWNKEMTTLDFMNKYKNKF